MAYPGREHAKMFMYGETGGGSQPPPPWPAAGSEAPTPARACYYTAVNESSSYLLGVACSQTFRLLRSSPGTPLPRLCCWTIIAEDDGKSKRSTVERIVSYHIRKRSRGSARGVCERPGGGVHRRFGIVGVICLTTERGKLQRDVEAVGTTNNPFIITIVIYLDTGGVPTPRLANPTATPTNNQQIASLRPIHKTAVKMFSIQR